MDRHVETGHYCGAMKNHWEFFEVKFDRLTQIGNSLFDRSALADRSRFRIERNIAALFSGGEYCGYLHGPYLS